MTVTVPTTIDHSAADPATTRPRLWAAGLVSGAVAAAVTSVVVLLARAAGEDVAIAGDQIPVAGFAQFVLIGAMLGVVLGKGISRRAQRPRSTFVRTTVALTALSIVPDLLIDAPLGTRLVLVATHVIAAAIIIPALAVRLAPSRSAR